jgi:hypothetical protein
VRVLLNRGGSGKKKVKPNKVEQNADGKKTTTTDRREPFHFIFFFFCLFRAAIPGEFHVS